MSTGCLIAFEGPEGAGKSTQIRHAAAALTAAGHHVVVTVEPGGTVLGQRVRQLVLHDDQSQPSPLAELFLILADRAQHVGTVIMPAISAGAVVLTDRFSGSTLAYQGYGRGLDMNLVTRADEWARQGLVPRATILLDCPADVGLQRAHGLDRFHAENLAFHERVRRGFLALAADDPAHWHVVDTTQPPGVVEADVLDILRRIVGQP